MSLLNLPLLNAISTDLEWRDQNMKVISGNIANSDTPNAKARVLNPVKFDSMLAGLTQNTSGKLQMATTNSEHLPNTKLSKTGGGSISGVQRATYEVNPNNNHIVLEEQLLAAQQNASKYNLAINMYRKSIGMMKLAVGANR